MIETKNLTKSFWDGGTETKVLKNINLFVKEKEFVAIMGRSGAGKSTLLYQISLLDEPTEGEIIIRGAETRGMAQKEKTLFRLTQCGYVFQDYALLPDLTARENVALPLLMQGLPRKEAYAKAEDALGRVRLAHRAGNLPSALSGGEQQRVSIARAIAHRPALLFADEPTANLDNESSEAIMDIFSELHKSGQTIIMATHEEECARRAERVVTIDDGKIISSIPRA